MIGGCYMICTFFGHRDTPKEIEPILKSTLIELVEKKDVNFFYVGNQGNFDCMVRKALKQLKICYPHIDYAVVLAYMSIRKDKYVTDFSDTIYPEELDSIHPKYAILKRNDWMINHSDYVVTYVKHSFGGAYKFSMESKRKGKSVINLADCDVVESARKMGIFIW